MGNPTYTLRQAVAGDADEIHRLVRETIRACYASCYTQPVVEGFCRYHSLESIVADVADGKVHVLVRDGRIVGTATRDGSYIGRVYVAPEEQGQGLGTRLMDTLEGLVADAGSTVATLDSSIPGKGLYERLGYTVVRTETWDIEPYADLPADRLVYEVMEKRLRA